MIWVSTRAQKEELMQRTEDCSLQSFSVVAPVSYTSYANLPTYPSLGTDYFVVVAEHGTMA